jgi:hypothetical protein
LDGLSPAVKLEVFERLRPPQVALEPVHGDVGGRSHWSTGRGLR